MSIDVTAQGTGSLTQRVAAQIRAVMAYNQIRQSHLARTMGVTEQWLSVRLRGVQPIDLNDLERIAKALGVEVSSLIPKSGSSPITVYPRNAPTRPADRRPRLRLASRRRSHQPGRISYVHRPLAA